MSNAATSNAAAEPLVTPPDAKAIGANITPGSIHFDAAGTPVSDQFDDIYYTVDNGLAETQHIFIDNNHLIQRWQDHDPQSGYRHFVIAETGFGSGLNFLAVWDCFNQWLNQWVSQPFNQNTDTTLTQLHFISFEKYPLTATDLHRVLQQWPTLAPLAALLIDQYPPLTRGCHRLNFQQTIQGRTTQILLDLWFGDIEEQLPTLFYPQQGLVDAWFLDGFAPGKNVAMWSPAVFEQMVKLSKQGATLATFTAAGVVKRGLKAAGFTIKKVPGHGKKREIITGWLANKTPPAIIPPFYYRPLNPMIGRQANIAIIGGGIASAALCYALAKRGYAITLYCKDPQLAQGASQNRQGALYPLLHAEYDSISEFYSQAYLYAVEHYRQLAKQYHFDHDFCGVLVQAFNQQTEKRQQALIDNQCWPAAIVQPVNAATASDIAGLALNHSGLYFKQGGWVNPPALIDALIQAASELTTVELKFNTDISDLQPLDQQWQLSSTQGDQYIHDIAVICSGHLSKAFSQTQALGLSGIRGQVSHVPVNRHSQALKTVLCYNGYMTPAYQGSHCLGASFIKGDDTTGIRDSEHQNNIRRLSQCLSQHPWVNELPLPTDGKAAIRCAAIDHMPLCGAVPNDLAYRRDYRDLWKGLKPHFYPFPPNHQGLFTFTALGARGLCSAPLCAEILAAQINNEPYPVSNRVLSALNPGRGYIKQLKSRNGSSPTRAN